MREQLRQASLSVEHLYTFDADAILIPPPLPKRTKKKKE
jgi:hypothetical protein